MLTETIRNRLADIEKWKKRYSICKPFYWYCVGKIMAYRYVLALLEQEK